MLPSKRARSQTAAFVPGSKQKVAVTAGRCIHIAQTRTVRSALQIDKIRAGLQVALDASSG